jgi:PAS domain S-box-containing protein
MKKSELRKYFGEKPSVPVDEFITSELRYRRLFETAQDGVLLVDAKTGMIMDVNPYLIKMLGYSKESFLRKHLWEVGIFKNVVKSKDNFKKLQRKKYIRYEDLPLETKSGQAIAVEFVANEYAVNDDVIIQCNIRDVTDRKKAEDLVKEQEDKFIKAFQLAPMPMAISSIKEGVYLEINDSFTKVLGYTRKDAIGHSSLKLGIFVDPKQRADAIKIVKKESGLHGYEVYFRHKNGQILTMLFYASIITVKGELYLLSQALDVTERKKFESNLKMEKNKLQQYLDVADVMLVTIDKHQKVVDINKKGSELLGYLAKDVIGKNWFNHFIPPRDRKKIKEIFNKIIKGESKGVERFENAILTKNGQEKIVSWHNKLIRDEQGELSLSLSSGEDITERRKYEKELITSEKKYEALVENSNDGVVVLQDGLIKFVNRVLSQITGIAIKDVLEKPFLEIISPKYRKMLAEKYQRRLAGLSTESLYSFDLIAKDGSFLPVEANLSLIQYNGRRADLAVVRDVRKAKEIDLMKAEFVSVASHQLRTPLTGIKWFSELLLSPKGEKISAKQRNYIQQIANSNERMIKLVNDLLDVSHIETGRKFTIIKKRNNFSRLFNHVLDHQSLLIKKKNLKIITKGKLNKKIYFDFDFDKIEQALTNLINNAIKYSKEGSKIIISFKKQHDWLRFSIKDSGYGIPQHQQHRVFEKFFRGDNIITVSTEGTGLGLYIVKGIIDGHGGKVWFKSKENQGTTFYFTLPLK